MYKALYRTERPETLSEVIGQEHIVRVIKNQLKNNKVAHAYLFCGTRGTGKTTLARILAKGVNCTAEGDRPCGVCDNCRAIQQGNFIDLIEVDAASNNGVDYIRNLRDSVNYPPAISRKKVYIIDEVHMLSNSAFNAFLKTLEEPPEHVMFILATTDPQKIPQTILSRCIRFDFKRVPEGLIMSKMADICRRRDVVMDDEAIRLLAANADGSVRDGLSLLEQCLAGGDSHVTRDMVLEFLGAVSQDFFIDLTEKILLHNAAEGLALLNDVIVEGKDPKLLLSEWLAHYRSLLITKFVQSPESMLNMSTENVERLKIQSSRIDLDEINLGIVTLSKTINDAKYSSQPRILMELAIVTLASGLNDDFAQIQKHKFERMAAKAPKSSAASMASAAASAATATTAPTVSIAKGERVVEKPASQSKSVEPILEKKVEQDHSQEQPEVMDGPWASIMEQARDFEVGYADGVDFEEEYPVPEHFAHIEPENARSDFESAPEEGADALIKDENDGEVIDSDKEEKTELSDEYKQKLAAIAMSASEYTDDELDEIWKRVVNRAIETKPVLFVALQGSSLLHLSEKDIRVSLRAEHLLAMINKDSELISDIIEDETGIHGYINFKALSENAEDDSADASEAKEKFEQKWGLELKVK